MDDEQEDAPQAPKSPPRSRREPVKPSDNLGQRRALAGHVFRGSPKVTAQRLREHSEKYGTDQIAEVAAEAGMDEEQLTNLIASLDRINATFKGDKRKKHLHVTPAKTTPGYRARQLLGIDEPEPLAKPSQTEAARGATVRGGRPKEGEDGHRARKTPARRTRRAGKGGLRQRP